MPQYDASITVIGETDFRSHRRRFGIKTDDRRRHMYLIGKTGMAKSTMLENMIIEDIRSGRGVGLVDPHGDLAEKILRFIPSNRINDVVYINPADMDYPVAFNILETADPRYKHLIAAGLMGVFKKIWPDVWSSRMEYILNNTLLALLDSPGSTMLGVNRMLSDKEYRKKIVEKIKDPVIKAFWEIEFAKYTERLAVEAVASIQNKVGQFLSSPVIRNVIGQVKSSVNIREAMDEGKILIMNLSKGRIGEDNSRLLGGMLITKIQLSAMERVEVPEEQRKDFYLYVDEFQNFATESFANILSEARKYRLNLIVAHQYIEQLDEKVAAGVFGNIGTIIVFRVGAADAEFLVKEFTPRFIEEDLVNLPKFHFYIKLMIDGVASEPFSAVGLTPLQKEEETNNEEKTIRVSRERFAVPVAVVEEKIRRWTQPVIEQMTADQKSSRSAFSANKGAYRDQSGGSSSSRPRTDSSYKTPPPRFVPSPSPQSPPVAPLPPAPPVVPPQPLPSPVAQPLSLKDLSDKKPQTFGKAHPEEKSE